MPEQEDKNEEEIDLLEFLDVEVDLTPVLNKPVEKGD